MKIDDLFTLHGVIGTLHGLAYLSKEEGMKEILLNLLEQLDYLVEEYKGSYRGEDT